MPGFRNENSDDPQSPFSWAEETLPFMVKVGKGDRSFEVTGNTPEEIRGVLEASPYSPVYDSKTLEKLGKDAPRIVLLPELNCPANSVERQEYSPYVSDFIVNCGMLDRELEKGEGKSAPKIPRDWASNGVFHDLLDPYLNVNPKDPVSSDPPNRISLFYIDQHDGLSNTLLSSERPDAGDWISTDEKAIGFLWVDSTLKDDNGDSFAYLDKKLLLGINEGLGESDGSAKFARPASRHMGGVNVTYCGGQTQFLSDKIDYYVYVQLMAPDNDDLKRAGSQESVSNAYKSEE